MSEPVADHNRRLSHLVLVTGLSGGGKSSALKYLEDLGFFWMDNLPLQMLVPILAQFAEEAGESRVERVAVGVHIRQRGCLSPFNEILKDLSRLAERFEMVFLEASPDVLVTRYRETRRRHPMAIERTVREAIEMEIAFMNQVRAEAHLIIDTSRLNVPKLKARIDDLFQIRAGEDLVIFIRSFGFKHGTNTDMDMVLDARFLPNPYYEEELRHLTGLDDGVQGFLENKTEVKELLDRLQGLFDYLVPRFIQEKKRYLTVDIGCTGGRHRSVYLVDALAKRLTYEGVRVQVRHRDMDRPGSERDR